MGMLDSNKKALENRFKDVLDFFESDENVESEIEVVLNEARDGSKALTVIKDEKSFRLNSAYRPLSEAKKWADQYEYHNIDIIVFMFGFGNGIFVRELLNRLAPDAKVFVYEPNAWIFEKIIETEDISDILKDDRFRILIGKKGLVDLREISRILVGWHNLPTQMQITHIGYGEIYPDEYQAFWHDVYYGNAMAKVRRNTNEHFAHVSIENILNNVKYIKDSNYITEFEGKIPEDVPVIIVSAGPSLDKNIELLREAKGKSIIVAVDTAVKILEERNVSYDCMVTVDPGKPAWYITNYPGAKNVPLFCCAEARGDILTFHEGRKIWLEASVYIENLYANHGMFFPSHNIGGSVATAAFVMSQNFGVKNIVLVGQDLAFSGESTHAGGHENHIADEEDSISMTEGIDGKPVRTRADWMMFKTWFEEAIKENPELNVIDATEGGALIEGSKVLTLRETIDEYMKNIDFSFEKFLSELKPTFDAVDFEPVKKDIVSIEKGFANVKRKAVEGLESSKEFLEAGRGISAKKHDRLLKEIRKVNNFIEKQPGYDLIETYTFELTSTDLQDINVIIGDSVIDEQNSVKCAKIIYEALIKAVDEIEDDVKKSLEFVK